MKKGVLLINLGTPDSFQVSDVRRYLREFLSDSRVIDLPFLMRLLLVECFILPFRPKASAHAYQSIWHEQGSPLLINSRNASNKLQQRLAKTHQVALAMRYGKPSIDDALSQLKDCQQITIIPLFPQYSSAATGSAIEAVLTRIKKFTTIPKINLIRDFYNHPLFIQAYANRMRQMPAQHYLFSYHGLPERQVIKAGCAKVCDRQCKTISPQNQGCYRAQCFETTRLIAQSLNLEANQYTLSFQSRLGKTPWIKPYTDETLSQLAEQGINDLAIVCPSFVADCLETLEEIGIQAQQQWHDLTGKNLKLIPCLNDSDEFIALLQAIVDDN